MLSPKRLAQFGLGAAGLVLFGSVLVLVRGAADMPIQAQVSAPSPLVGPAANPTIANGTIPAHP